MVGARGLWFCGSIACAGGDGAAPLAAARGVEAPGVVGRVRPGPDGPRVWLVGPRWATPGEVPAQVESGADGTLFLADLHVRSDMQKRGAGRMLLRRVVDHGRWAFFPAVTLLTDRFVPWNAPFYAADGFVMLDAARLPPQLSEKRASDLARGHDPARRVAMAKRL